MESAIISTASSLDEVLEKLNKDEKERKIGRKEMENIFDNIVNNGEGESKKYFIYNKFTSFHQKIVIQYKLFFNEMVDCISP